MNAMPPLPLGGIRLYDLLWNEARSHNLVPERWRLSVAHAYGPQGRLSALLGLPVYYAHDTRYDQVILETNHGDVVQQVVLDDVEQNG